MAVERCRDAPHPGPEACNRRNRQNQLENQAGYLLSSKRARLGKDRPQELSSQEIVRNASPRTCEGSDSKVILRVSLFPASWQSLPSHSHNFRLHHSKPSVCSI